MNTNKNITELSPRFKDLSLHKMMKQYAFLSTKTELSEKELWGKERLKKYIEISLQSNEEWGSLILFTNDKQIISVCQEKIDVNAIVDEIFNQQISRLQHEFRTFFFNSFNFN